MNPITHALTGWCLAEAMPNATKREKAMITIAAVAPDIDGLGMVAELATRDSARPLFWWTDYHHVLAHNLLFAIGVAIVAGVVGRGSTAIGAFVAVHLHILGDLAGSRGPDGYQWPIPYLWPRAEPQLVWEGQWELNAWQNIAITAVLMAVTIGLGRRRGYSIVGLFSEKADRAFLGAWRRDAA